MALKLKPSARMKKRYLLLNGRKEEIEKAMIEYLGVLGTAKAAPFFVENKSGKVILCVERAEVDNVIAAFAFFDGRIEVLRVSGTIKGLGKK